MANPAYRTCVGNMAGNVAEMVDSCGMYSSPSTRNPTMAQPKPCPISQYIGNANTNRPISEPHHIGLRPILSDQAPKNGIHAIIASSPMRMTTVPVVSLMPMVVLR